MQIQDAIAEIVGAYTRNRDRHGWYVVADVAPSASLTEAWSTLRDYARLVRDGRAARIRAGATLEHEAAGPPVDPETPNHADHADRFTRARRSPPPVPDFREEAAALAGAYLGTEASSTEPREVRLRSWMVDALRSGWERGIRDAGVVPPPEPMDRLVTWGAAPPLDLGPTTFQVVEEPFPPPQAGAVVRRLPQDPGIPGLLGEDLDPNRTMAVAVAMCLADGVDPYAVRPDGIRWLSYEQEARRQLAAFRVLSPRLGGSEPERGPDQEAPDPTQAVALAMARSSGSPEAGAEAFEGAARAFLGALEAAGYRARGRR